MFGAAWPGCTEDGQPPDKETGNERLYSVHTKLCAPDIVDEETGSGKKAETLDQDVRTQSLLAPEINDVLGSARALRRLLVFDTGQSGGRFGLTRTARSPFAFRGAVERLARAQGTFAIAAAAVSDEAAEVPQLKHGVLTYSLLAGLHAVDEGTQVRVHDLFESFLVGVTLRVVAPEVVDPEHVIVLGCSDHPCELGLELVVFDIPALVAPGEGLPAVVSCLGSPEDTSCLRASSLSISTSIDKVGLVRSNLIRAISSDNLGCGDKRMAASALKSISKI